MVQRVISTLGRLDRLNAKGDIESLVRSLPRCSEQALLVLSGKSNLLVEDGRRLAIRTQCEGTCGKVFQAVGIAVPPTMR